MGAVVSDVAQSFDEFWNHSKALPIEHLRKVPSKQELDQTLEKIRQLMHSEGLSVYQAAIDSKLINDLIEGHISDFIADAYVLSESPEKLEVSTKDDSMRLSKALGEILLRAQNEVLIFTPYFVPTKNGMDFW